MFLNERMNEPESFIGVPAIYHLCLRSPSSAPILPLRPRNLKTLAQANNIPGEPQGACDRTFFAPVYFPGLMGGRDRVVLLYDISYVFKTLHELKASLLESHRKLPSVLFGLSPTDQVQDTHRAGQGV